MEVLNYPISIEIVLLVLVFIILIFRCITLEGKKRELAQHAMDIGIKHLHLLISIKELNLMADGSVDLWDGAIDITESYIEYMKKEVD